MLGVFVLNITNTNPRYGKEKSKSGEDVSVEQRGQLFRLLDRYVECFNTDVESTLNHGVEHHTDTGGARPILTFSIRLEDREKTAFATADGLFQFRRIPFDLGNSPATFVKFVHKCCGTSNELTAYLYTKTTSLYLPIRSSHLERLGAVLGALQLAELKLNSGKLQVSCDLFCFLSFSRNLSLG